MNSRRESPILPQTNLPSPVTKPLPTYDVVQRLIQRRMLGGEKGMTDAWTFVRLSIWWLPFNCLWTALLTQGLQVRVEHLAPPEAKGGALATLTAIGAALSLASQVLPVHSATNVPTLWGEGVRSCLWEHLHRCPSFSLSLGLKTFGWSS